MESGRPRERICNVFKKLGVIFGQMRGYLDTTSVFFSQFLFLSSFYIPFLFPFVETSDIPSPMHMVTIKRQTVKIFIYSLQDFKCHNSFSLLLNVRNISIELFSDSGLYIFRTFRFRSLNVRYIYKQW